MTLPTDTIIDTDDTYEEMGEEFCENARKLMKALYLAHPLADNLRGQGFNDTAIIDAGETLRRKGCLRIVWNEDDDTYRIELTGKPLVD